MPRVLYIHTQALRAETPHARRTFEMLTLMRRAGLSVDVLTLPRGDAWPKGLADHVYRTLPVPFARSLPPYGTGLRRRWATFVTALAAARLLLHTRYDAVHCADRAVRVGTLLAWLFGVRLVFEWRTASGHDLTAWARARSKRALRAVGLVVADAPCRPAGLRETGLLGRIAVIPPLPAPADSACVAAARAELEQVYVHPDLLDYAAQICEATRTARDVALGASPRAMIALVQVARGWAALQGRDWTLPDDVKRAAVPVLAHRLVFRNDFFRQSGQGEELVRAVLDATPVPSEDIDFGAG